MIWIGGGEELFWVWGEGRRGRGQHFKLIASVLIFASVRRCRGMTIGGPLRSLHMESFKISNYTNCQICYELSE